MKVLWSVNVVIEEAGYYPYLGNRISEYLECNTDLSRDEITG